MIEVVGVHGVGKQQLGPNQLVQSWQAALWDGLDAAEAPPALRPLIRMAYYGRLFLPDASGTKGPGSADGPLSDEEVAFFAELADDLELNDAPVADDGKGVSRLPLRAQRVVRYLEKAVGAANVALYVADFRQVRRFRDSEELAEAAVRCVYDAVGDDSVGVLIGHSLGSVVAYEALCRRPELRVTTLVTLGSPLGLPKTVLRHLRARLKAIGSPEFPPQLRRWVNVADPRDPVAAFSQLGEIWPMVEDHDVDNGVDAHDVCRYLGKEATGRAVLGTVLELGS